MRSIDRLSALDAAFIDLDTPRAPLHVGWTMRFEGRAPTLSALRRHLEARLDQVPRFRRRAARAPGGLAWVDDQTFDIARHVHAVSLAAPGGPAELRDVAGVLLSGPLDPERPLWRLHLVERPTGDGFALVGQAHHALVDGIAAVDVAMLLFDVAGAEPRAPSQIAWSPKPPPTRATAIGDAAGAGMRGGLDVLRELGRRAAQPAASSAALREARDTIAGVLSPAPATGLDRSVTARRTVGFATASLDGVREAGRRRGATINDVLLAASSLALGRALRGMGDRPAFLKALVPVDVRDGAADAELGNAISFMPVDLPVAETDPSAVLRTIRDRTRVAKSGGAAAAFGALARAGDLLPPVARRLVARAAMRAAPFNAAISNVPGPPVPLALLGRRLTSIHPAVPLLDGHAVSIGALSYEGRLHVGLYADPAIVTDVAGLARDVESAFDTLRLAPERPTGPEPPWRRRAQARRAATRSGTP